MVTLKAEMLQKLLDVSREMAETRELDPLLNYAMMLAMQLVNAQMGYLILVDEQDRLDFRVRLTHEGHEIDRPIEQISHSILAEVVREEKEVMIADAMDDYSDSDSVLTLQLRSVMAVPLISRERKLGALYVENRSEQNIFSEEDLKVLKFFAAQAAVAIENAMLNDELEARVAARTAELQAANDQLQSSFSEAVEFNKLRSNFLSTIVHDIRSPLSTVLNAQLLMAEAEFGPVTEEQQQWINTSVQTIEHIIRLTDDIFDLTKLEMGKLTLYTEPILLDQYLQQVFDVCAIIPWQVAVKFRLELADDLPVMELDPTRMRQVIMNLVTNAHKFTKAGEVVLYARPAPGGVMIGVRDTGVGIPQDQIDMIFERFQQAGTKTMRSQGTGLGLAISKEIVGLHNGTISVKSEPDKGTDFQVTLPV